MAIPMQELVTILGPEKALVLASRFEGDEVPASSRIARYLRNQEIRRLHHEGISFQAISERVGVSYRTILRVTKQRQN